MLVLALKVVGTLSVSYTFCVMSVGYHLELHMAITFSESIIIF